MRLFITVCAATAVLFGCSSEESPPNAGGGSSSGSPTEETDDGASGADVGGAPHASGEPPRRQLDPISARARSRYATVGDLFDKFVATSCTGGPGTCHHGRAAPDLTSFESFAMAIGAPCQVDVARAQLISDSCETAGDSLRFRNGVEREIWRVLVAPDAPTPPQAVTVELSGAAGPVEDLARVRYPLGSTSEPFVESLKNLSATVSRDEKRLELDLTRASAEIANAWDPRRFPKGGLDVRVADPNGNGNRGSALPLRQLFPGKPEQSLLLLRLLGETGARMPLGDEPADDASVRALYCFIETTRGGAPRPSTSIDYESCNPRDLGTAPLTALGGVITLFNQRCNTGPCHGADAAGNLDLRESSIKAGGLIGKMSSIGNQALITPGAPNESFLLCKVDPNCDLPTGSARMPLAGSALSSSERELIERWIEQGAELE